MAKNSLLQAVMVRGEIFHFASRPAEKLTCYVFANEFGRYFCNTLHYFNFGTYGPKVCTHTAADTWYTNRLFCPTCKDMSISHWEMKIQTYSVIIFMHAQLTREANTDLHSHRQTHTVSAASLAQGRITSIGLWGWIMLNCLFWLKTWGASHKHSSLPSPPFNSTRNISSHLFFFLFFFYCIFSICSFTFEWKCQELCKIKNKQGQIGLTFIRAVKKDRIIYVAPVFASPRQRFMSRASTVQKDQKTENKTNKIELEHPQV